MGKIQGMVRSGDGQVREKTRQGQMSGGGARFRASSRSEARLRQRFEEEYRPGLGLQLQGMLEKATAWTETRTRSRAGTIGLKFGR